MLFKLALFVLILSTKILVMLMHCQVSEVVVPYCLFFIVNKLVQNAYFYLVKEKYYLESYETNTLNTIN